MEDSIFQLKDFTYYSRIVMMIILSVQFVLFIIFIVFIHDIKGLMTKVNDNVINFHIYKEVPYDISDIFHEQTQGIDACISFFIISFVVFLVEFIAHFCYDDDSSNRSICNKIFFSWNHLLTLLSFIIGQFLYIIACLIIPIYLDRMTSFRDLYKKFPYISVDPEKDEETIDSCVNYYAGLLVIAFVFLFIFIFLNFIILNLYKGICCDMIVICNKSKRCIGSFFACFYDNVFYFCNTCQMRNQEMNDLEKNIEKTKAEIEETTCEIQNKMKENIELRVKNMDYL